MRYGLTKRMTTIGIYVLCSFIFVISGSLLVREKSFNDEYRYLRIGGDAQIYISMTEMGHDAAPSPFRYRILLPSVASLIDAPAITTFRLLNYAALFFFYLFGFLICEHSKIELRAALMGMLFVFLTPWHLYIYQNPFITDGIVQMVIIALVYASLAKKFWLFAFLAFIGVFLHERILFFLPLWLMMHEKKRGGIVLGTAAMMYIGLRIYIVDGTGAEFTFSELSIYTKPLEILKDGIIGSLPLYLIALTGFLLLNVHEEKKIRPIVLISLAASIIPALVATDTGRMLLGFAPIAVLLSASFFSKPQVSFWGTAIIFFTLLISFAYIPVTFIPLPEWLVFRKYIIAGSFVVFLICYSVVVYRNRFVPANVS